jgi:hypothetical protein
MAHSFLAAQLASVHRADTGSAGLLGGRPYCDGSLLVDRLSGHARGGAKQRYRANCPGDIPNGPTAGVHEAKNTQNADNGLCAGVPEQPCGQFLLF